MLCRLDMRQDICYHGGIVSIGGMNHADIRARAGELADTALLPMYGGANMGVCGHHRAAFSEVARFSGGV